MFGGASAGSADSPSSAGNWVPFEFRELPRGLAGHLDYGHDGRRIHKEGRPACGAPFPLKRRNQRQAEARATANQESTLLWLLAIHCVARSFGVSPPS